MKRAIARVAVGVLLACSPEAWRTRDGGPGADIGNKHLVEVTHADPQPSDTTLMPGRALTPVERFQKGAK